MKVGFVGLGNMGFGMAENIVKNGFETYGFDLNPKALERFAEIGGKTGASSADIAKDADVVLVMTMNGPQADAVLFGENGVCETLKEGGTAVVCASCGPEWIKKLGEKMPEGRTLIDCPVTGGAHGAKAGTLTLMVSGDKAKIEEICPVLEACSSRIYNCGPNLGDGQNAKSCNQAITGVTYVATAECLALAMKVGLDPQIVTDIIGNGVAGSDIFRTIARNAMDRKFENAGANIMTMYKDMNIVQDIARSVNMPLFLTNHANEYFHVAYAKHPEQDCWGIVRVTEELCDVEIRRPDNKE